MSNPAVYTVRKLSERHSISLKRVDAILRLKGLEEHWKKVSNDFIHFPLSLWRDM